ncbi:MAG: hypothetical protein U0175_02615 [Caldilineaceae bacterium]
MNAFYRLRQFWQGFFARIAPEELQAIQPLLPPDAFALFCRLPRDAQRHSLNVLHDLQQRGPLHPDLAIAALLHDVGKLAADEAGVSINLWLRGPLVLLKALAPALFQRLQSPTPASGWRYALYVSEAHPQIGAKWAHEAGCSALACWLIEQHQEHQSLQTEERYVLLRNLQAADARY